MKKKQTKEDKIIELLEEIKNRLPIYQTGFYTPQYPIYPNQTQQTTCMICGQLLGNTHNNCRGYIVTRKS